MNKARYATAILFAILLFGCGVLTGVLGYRYYDARSVKAKGLEDMRKQYLTDMQTKLQLTPDQVEKLKAIMQDTHQRLVAVRESSRPAIVKIKQEHSERVKSILTPQQIPIYERMLAEREKHEHQHH
jgi:Spy/CpxP family protein refolding chaperone